MGGPNPRSGESDRPDGRRGAGGRLVLVLPFLAWFRRYTPAALQTDFMAGLTVALVLIPQSMAYAQLADLPAYYGLYAAFLPPLVAALFGSSHQLATGPVAVVSLMTSTALAPLATAGSESFIAYAVLLALIVGVFQLLLGVLRLGLVVNFLSHPVVNGFTNAAALIIATSQLATLFGVSVDKSEHHYQTVYRAVLAAWHGTHWPTLGLAALAFAIMIGCKRLNARLPSVLIAVVITTVISWTTGFERTQMVTVADIESPRLHALVQEYNADLARIEETMAERVEVGRSLKETVRSEEVHSFAAIELEAQAARLGAIATSLKEKTERTRSDLRRLRLRAVQAAGGASYRTVGEGSPDTGRRGRVWRLKVGNRPLDEAGLTLDGGGAVVGAIPRGLPRLAPPKVDLAAIPDLLPMAVVISLLGFMEAISIAKAMAARTGQRLDANQELVGQGLANIVGSFTRSYPVSGSFSRSAVNLQAGAVTGMSSVFSSVVVLLALLLLTPLLYHLPQSVLAAIIMMAVVGLLNVTGFVHAWHAQRYDGVISVISFVCTLAFAPHLDKGILIGVLLSLAVYLYRNMRPEMAVLARSPEGDYRHAGRWGLQTCDHIAVFRFNSSLIFANVNHLETEILREVELRTNLKHVLIVGNGINELDASGEVMLSFLVSKLRQSGVDVSFSGLNDHVLAVMKRTHLFEKIGQDHFYRSVSVAVAAINHGICLNDPDHPCPLLDTHPQSPATTRGGSTAASSVRLRG